MRYDQIGRGKGLFAMTASLSVSNRHNISVLHDVVLPLESPESGFFDFGKRSSVHDEIVVVNDLSTNELVDKIGVNHACGFLRGNPSPDRPCPTLVLTDGKKRLQSKQGVRFTDERVERGLLDAILIHEEACFAARKLRHFHLDLSEERDHFRIL